MPTLDEWEAALSVPRSILVDSTEALARRVNRKSGSQNYIGTAKTATGVPEFSPPRRISVLPAEILYMIGRITTPRIENLADLCSTWARIRYLWAFSPDQNVSSLRLSNEALEIDFHQKGLLSDEIGIGMSALLVERYFNGSNPIDVDVAVQNQFIPGMQIRYRTKPDYLFEVEGGRFLVVECKGTQSGRQSAFQQLKRGTEQVPSLIFPNGGNPTTLVIGTSLTRRETNVFIVDPPSETSPKDDPRKRFIRDEQQFRKNLELAQFSNLYLYAGVTRQAIELNPYQKTKARLRRLPQRDHPPAQIRVSEIQEDYVGISQDVNLIGDVNRAVIFQGISEKVYGALDGREKQAVLHQANINYDKVRQLPRRVNLGLDNAHYDAGAYSSDRSENSMRVDVFGKDGTFLRIEISRR